MNKVYTSVSLAFSALKWVHDIILHSVHGNPVDTAFPLNIVEANKHMFRAVTSHKKSLKTPDIIYCI